MKVRLYPNFKVCDAFDAWILWLFQTFRNNLSITRMGEKNTIFCNNTKKKAKNQSQIHVK